MADRHADDAGIGDFGDVGDGRVGDVTLIWWGEVDLYNARGLQVDLLDAAGSGATAIHVDLTGVTFMDSFGMGILLSGRKHARSRSVPLKISEPSGQVRRALELMGVLEVLLPRANPLPTEAGDGR